MGYVDAGRRRETTIVSTPTVDDAIALVADRRRIATVLALGIRAMPRAIRPELPDWVAEDQGARRTRHDLNRASAMADGAAAHEEDDAPPGSAPF